MFKYSPLTLDQMIDAMVDYDGSFEEFQVQENDIYFFDNFIECMSKGEIIECIYYGKFDHDDEYVRLDSDGHLESLSASDREEELLENHDKIVEAYKKLVESEEADPRLLYREKLDQKREELEMDEIEEVEKFASDYAIDKVYLGKDSLLYTDKNSDSIGVYMIHYGRLEGYMSF